MKYIGNPLHEFDAIQYTGDNTADVIAFTYQYKEGADFYGAPDDYIIKLLGLKPGDYLLYICNKFTRIPKSHFECIFCEVTSEP